MDLSDLSERQLNFLAHCLNWGIRLHGYPAHIDMDPELQRVKDEVEKEIGTSVHNIGRQDFRK